MNTFSLRSQLHCQTSLACLTAAGLCTDWSRTHIVICSPGQKIQMKDINSWSICFLIVLLIFTLLTISIIILFTNIDNHDYPSSRL